MWICIAHFSDCITFNKRSPVSCRGKSNVAWGKELQMQCTYFNHSNSLWIPSSIAVCLTVSKLDTSNELFSRLSSSRYSCSRASNVGADRCDGGLQGGSAVPDNWARNRSIILYMNRGCLQKGMFRLCIRANCCATAFMAPGFLNSEVLIVRDLRGLR